MKRTDRIEILQKEMEKHGIMAAFVTEIGRASCRERVSA